MGIGDTPSFSHLNEQMRGFNLILRANQILRRVGLGSEKLAGLRAELDNIRAQMRELADYPERFNEHFSNDGWLAHGRMDFAVLKQAVDECEARGHDAGTAVLLRYYAPDSIRNRLMTLDGVDELRVRRRLIDLAFADYEARRFHSVVPVLLMMIDGAVNDAAGKGFHAQGLDLEVWDSMTTADGAINDIRSIFQRSRRKTRTEEIALPYRNGILHGMDLGYDNEVVAAKCWCFLFVAADWIADRKSEDQRRERFAKETRVPSLRELAADIADNQRVQVASESWRPREMGAEELQALNAACGADEGTPEEAVLRFLELWSSSNYGDMAKLYWPGLEMSPRDLRAMFESGSNGAWRLTEIEDRAPAITHVAADVETRDSEAAPYDVRLIYCNAAGDALPRGLDGGEWRIVWAQLRES